MRKISVCLLAAFALAGCELFQPQVNGGVEVPTLKSQVGSKNIVPSAAALTMEATEFCNAQAQVDYSSLVLACEGKTPTIPVSVATTYGLQVAQFNCQVYGFTNASNQLIVPATVPLSGCVGPAGVVKPTPVPSAAATPAA